MKVSADMPRPKPLIWILAAVAGAIALLVLWPCIHGSFLQWDDLPDYVGPVSAVGGLSWRSIGWAFTQSAKIAGYYHPVTWLSFLLEYSVWRFNPLPYHVTNLLLHVLNTMLIVIYFNTLLQDVSIAASERMAVASAIGVLFAIHPLQVESVAWIAERKTLLCTVFMIGTLYAQVRLAENSSSRTWWGLMNGLFLLALLAKPMAIPLPAVLLVLDAYPLRRQQRLGWARLVTEKAPMVALSVAASGATLLTQSHQGAINVALSVPDRLLTIPRNLIFYIWKIIWPAWLSPFYPASREMSAWTVEYLVPIAICSGLVVLGVLYRRRRPIIRTVLLVYGLLMAPVCGIVPLGDYTVADRYAYIGLLPVLGIAAAATLWMWRRLGKLGRTILAGGVVCLFSFYAQRARSQIPVWRNDETLWAAVLTHFPNSPLANCQFAAALVDQRRFAEAERFARRAVHLAPDFAEALGTEGLIDLKLHRYHEAANELSEAIQIKQTLWNARYNLACAYARLGRLDDAWALLDKVIASHPEYTALAVRDRELAALRNDPRYETQFAQLIAAAQSQSKR